MVVIQPASKNYIGGSEASRYKSAKALDRRAQLKTESPKVYERPKKNLTGSNVGIQTFVQGLIAKTNKAPMWVNPALYTALAEPGSVQ